MTIFRYEISLDTSKRTEIIDITLDIQEILTKSKLNFGIINIFSKHSTSSIVINENEEGLLYDFESILNKIIPNNNSYNHDIIDNNADSHIKSLFLGSSETIPFSNNDLSVGTWQSVFFVEFDGPRTRKVELTVIGE
ncbi:MAG: secondary thiamine-phosphate synthase enzyme YjbQ [Methanobrevibacter arboriphilus]|nr:secondary thiamine-phosphate synthase enzyme YjbQ [Methanobrevibacter arboriphilus]MCC7562207.1 secondary thiamine-phosphate synthase enzyme YjbQ [Methanobrevibacter arboriphilus]